MSAFKFRTGLILCAALLAVWLVGLLGVTAQTAPPLFATNTPQGGAPAGLTQPWFNDYLTQGVSASPTPTRTTVPVAGATSETQAISSTLYTQGRASVRECARRDCALLGVLGVNALVAVTGETTGEAVVPGNPLWYRVDYSEGEGYVYSGLLGQQPGEAVAPELAPLSQPGRQFSSAPSGASLTCNGQDNLGCSSFANIAQAQMHLIMCGDEDDLDTDNDGFACEASQN